MSNLFTVISPNEERRITACVGFVYPKDQPQTYIAVRNKRGWDIPGGHVEEGEAPDEAFSREVLEESACIVQSDATCIAILESVKNPATGIAVYYGSCETDSFTATDEIVEIAFMEKDELLQNYFGDKELLQELIDLIP